MGEGIKNALAASKIAWMIGAGLIALTVYVVTMRVELNSVMADDVDVKQQASIDALEAENHKKDLRMQAMESQLKINTNAISNLEKAIESNTSITKTGARENQETQRMIRDFINSLEKVGS